MPRYLLKVDGKTTGPFSETALKEMASVRAFKDDALVAPELTEDWKAIRELPELHALLFPPKKEIKLKVRSFETVEQTHAEPITVDEILQENLAAERNAPRKRLKRLPNRRRRDFLFSIIVVDGALGAIFYYLPRNEATDVALGSAAALLSLAIYWLFYHIMDRY